MTDYVYKTDPFEHQHKVFMVSRDREYFALLMEMGTGKTKVSIDTGAWLYSQGRINAIMVIAPNGVHRNWILNEVPAHCPDYTDPQYAYYASGMTRKEEECLERVLKSPDGLKVVAMNVESLVTTKAVSFLKNFLINFSTLLIIDESSTIKSPKAIRTKTLLKLSHLAKYRRILTGTPVTQGPLDLFTQFSFLDDHILRTGSYYAFRNRYAIMREMKLAGGRSFQTVTGYTNLEHLQELIAPHSYRVTKSECLDLPEKLYTKRFVTLSPTQASLYKSLKKEVVAEFNGMTMSAPLALTKLLRLQQIVGGFFVPDPNIIMNEETGDGLLDFGTLEGKPMYTDTKPQPIDEKNHRVESLIELLEETDGKVIIWARFRAEIEEIVKRIKETFGHESVVEYHGGINNSDRTGAIHAFQTTSGVRFFVGHVQAGGKGITLHAATTVVYFSNDFSLENRLQSEDRAHRIGQKNNVLYIDMVATGTLDDKVVATLRAKKDVATLITGDQDIQNWI